MRWVILDGGAPDDGEVAALGDLLTSELDGTGSEVSRKRLAELEIAPCKGCFGCWVQQPGECLQEDDARQVSAAMAASDVVVLLTRVTFGGYSWRLKQAMDRSICLVSPLFTTAQSLSVHRPRYARYPALLGLGLVGRIDEQAAVFATLVERNARNLHAPLHAAEVVVGGSGDGEARRRVAALVAAAGAA